MVFEKKDLEGPYSSKPPLQTILANPLLAQVKSADMVPLSILAQLLLFIFESLLIHLSTSADRRDANTGAGCSARSHGQVQHREGHCAGDQEGIRFTIRCNVALHCGKKFWEFCNAWYVPTPYSCQREDSVLVGER